MSLTAIPGEQSVHEVLWRDPRWALVQRIAHSATLGRSEQLTKLLLYVSKMAILDRADEISEQRVGIDVFGRPADYDSAIDGIVRSHATRLRRRLELYFKDEGCNEPLIVDIPRGGYVPRFVARTPADIEEKAESTEAQLVGDPAVPVSSPNSSPVSSPNSSEVADSPRDRRHAWLMPFLVGIALSALICAVVGHLIWDAALAGRAPAQQQTTIERHFWSTLFPTNGKTLLVPGDSGLVLYETTAKREITLADYMDGSYRDRQLTRNLPEQNLNHIAIDLAGRRYTSIVDLRLVSQLSHLPEWSPERVETVFARDLSPAAAQSNNLILIGSREANPWISLVEPQMNFYLARTKPSGYLFINRHPKPGEQAVYTPGNDPEIGNLGSSLVYGVVAYLPNPGGQGMILVLSGLWMSGTQSAGNFVLNGGQFAHWLQSIVRPDGSIPPFELLIRTKSLGGSATSSTILTSRLMGK